MTRTVAYSGATWNRVDRSNYLSFITGDIGPAMYSR